MPVVGRILLPFWVLLRLESVLVRLLLSVLVLMLRLYPGIAVFDGIGGYSTASSSRGIYVYSGRVSGSNWLVIRG